MTTSTWVGQIDKAERLRYVDAQIAAFCERRAQETEAAAAPVAAAPAIPAPRRVRVFLRGPGEGGHFATLTTTRAVVPRPRSLATT